MSKSGDATKKSIKRKPALTPEENENRLINKAMKEAEKRLDNGTASSQMILHFCKLGSSETEIDKGVKRADLKLKEAKAEAIESSKEMKEMYEEAKKAMTAYKGEDYEED